jgi:hypothetical protein
MGKSKESESKVKTTRKPWSKKDDETLLKMAKQGASSREISKVLNRTVPSIWTRLWNLKKPAPQASQSQNPVVAPKNKRGRKPKNTNQVPSRSTSDDFDILKKIASERGVTIMVSISA